MGLGFFPYFASSESVSQVDHKITASGKTFESSVSRKIKCTGRTHHMSLWSLFMISVVSGVSRAESLFSIIVTGLL